MVSVLSAQRDRFRARAAQLEDQLTQVWAVHVASSATDVSKGLGGMLQSCGAGSVGRTLNF